VQRVRFACALVFSVCLGCDYLTVYLPHLFILLAGVANVGKAVSITAYASTQPAIMRSFARDDNIADVTARCQAQNMVVDQAAILLASALTWSVRRSIKWQMLLPLVRMQSLQIWTRVTWPKPWVQVIAM
jgi:Vitamin B6 photo-protection and homoeostasis